MGKRRIAAVLLATLTLAASALWVPVPALAQAASALAPERSLQPLPRPVLSQALAGLTAGEDGIRRPAPPPPRPLAMQGPASMVPVVAAPPTHVSPAADFQGETPARGAASPLALTLDPDANDEPRPSPRFATELPVFETAPPPAVPAPVAATPIDGMPATRPVLPAPPESLAEAVSPALSGAVAAALEEVAVSIAVEQGRPVVAPAPRPGSQVQVPAQAEGEAAPMPGGPAPAATQAAVDQALAAVAPAPRPEAIAALVTAALAQPIAPEAEIDRRAVRHSLVPRARTADALRRHRTAAAAVATARAETPRAIPAAAGQTAAPSVAAPSGPGLCGVVGLQGRALSRIRSSTQGCGIDNPVSVTHVHGIRLSQAATLDCSAARATARWVGESMIPAVGRQGGGISEIRVAAHYACRTRNNQRGARISEHGRGRAIDISGYRLADGTQVTVLRDYRSGPHSAALRRMRANACGIFRTTLGPGSDRFHNDHFHFDTAQHRGGGTFCR